MAKSMNPLPSLIRASAQDAGNFSMRAANRTRWNEDDWNAAASTQERLILACYGKPGENNQNMAFIRFSIAEAWQKAGHIHLNSDWSDVLRQIDAAQGA